MPIYSEINTTFQEAKLWFITGLPQNNCVASFCGKRRNNGAKIAFGFTRKHWSKVCFDDIAKFVSTT